MITAELLTIKPNIFDIAKKDNPSTTILSTHQLMLKTGLSENKSHATSKTHKLLKKSLVLEPDRVRILEIFSEFTAPFNICEAKTLIEWFKIIKDELGEEVFCFVSNPASFCKATLSDVIILLQNLIEISSRLPQITPSLLQFYNQKISLKRVLRRIDRLKIAIDNQRYPEKDLDEVMKAFAFTGKNSLVSTPLKAEELVQIKNEYLEIVHWGEQFKNEDLNVLISLAKRFKNFVESKCIPRKEQLKLIAIGREVIKRKFKIYPYNTQILTVLGLIRYPKNVKGRIAQVLTGEGKSLINTLLGFYYAFHGYAVDMISTSRYLALRDQKRYEHWFNLFGIATSHLCTDEPTQENFKGLVIYGTNHDLEFALLRDNLGQEKIRRLIQDGKKIPRPLKVAIVDEVDSLFIDSALNSARIAVPAKDEMSWIYSPILDFVKHNKERVQNAFASQHSTLPQNQELKSALLNDIRKQLLNYHEGKFASIVAKLKDKEMEIPSAYRALYEKQRDKDYVIKPIEVQTPKGKAYQSQVVIVDKDTGRLQANSRWQRGLHEFIEVKENLLPKDKGLMAASFCHPIYFNQYEIVIGISGTIADRDKKEIEEMYNVDTFDVPPHKESLRKILDPIICDLSLHFKALLEEVIEMQKKERPILILFENIQDTNAFSQYLKENKIFSQLLNERQSEHEDFVVAKAGAPGMVTIATNTAGRGTDIILHPSSLAHGGLHMVFAFYPENERVEAQGFGRAGRQGQPGSCRLILALKNQSSDPVETLALLKKERELRGKRLSKERKERLSIEKINHGYLTTFSNYIQKWESIITDPFLEKVSVSLKNKIKGIAPTLKPSSQFDQLSFKLHRTFVYQATNTALDSDSWIPFLKSVRYALQTKLLQDWADLFYNRLDDLYQKAKNTLPAEEQLEDYYKFLTQKKFSNTQGSRWEHYLSNPQEGFMHYINFICSL